MDEDDAARVAQLVDGVFRLAEEVQGVRYVLCEIRDDARKHRRAADDVGRLLEELVLYRKREEAERCR